VSGAKQNSTADALVSDRLVLARWFAGAAIVAVWLSGAHARFLALGLGLLAINGALSAAASRVQAATSQDARQLVASQLALDLAALTLALHWLELVASPLALLYLLPLAVASVSLPVQSMMILGAVAAVFYCGGSWQSRQWTTWPHCGRTLLRSW